MGARKKEGTAILLARNCFAMLDLAKLEKGEKSSKIQIMGEINKKPSFVFSLVAGMHALFSKEAKWGDVFTLLRQDQKRSTIQNIVRTSLCIFSDVPLGHLVCGSWQD